VLPRAPAPIRARDLASKALDAARRNAAAAGVAADVVFEQGDARDLEPPAGEPDGTIVANPPYGERLAAGRAPEQGDGAPRAGAREGRPRQRGHVPVIRRNRADSSTRKVEWVG